MMKRVAARAPGQEMALRIHVVDPPSDVVFAVQEGRNGLIPPSRRRVAEVTFDFALRVCRGEGDEVRILGDCAQGPPAKRFVYVSCGALAGDAASRWRRRAKVPLTSITAAQVDRALATGAVLEARIAGTARDGGPRCATVPLLDGGWVVSAD